MVEVSRGTRIYLKHIKLKTSVPGYIILRLSYYQNLGQNPKGIPFVSISSCLESGPLGFQPQTGPLIPSVVPLSRPRGSSCSSAPILSLSRRDIEHFSSWRHFLGHCAIIAAGLQACCLSHVLRGALHGGSGQTISNSTSCGSLDKLLTLAASFPLTAIGEIVTVPSSKS